MGRVVERFRGRPPLSRWAYQSRVSRARWAPATVIGVAAGLAIVALAGAVYLYGAVIATQVGEQRTVSLPDGSHVYLNTDTRIVTRFSADARKIELKSGEALFEVAKENARPFIVVAGSRQVKALGTTFVVRRDSHKTAVTLIEGKVAISSSEAWDFSPPPEPIRGGQETRLAGSRAVSRPLPAATQGRANMTTLSAGERVTFDTGRPAQLDSPSLDQVTAWRQGQVALEDMPLSSAVIEMNRYSAVKLVVEEPEAQTLRVGGFFRIGDSSSFAYAVASTYGLQVIENKDQIVLAGGLKH